MVTIYYIAKPSIDTMIITANYPGHRDLIIGFLLKEKGGIFECEPIYERDLDYPEKANKIFLLQHLKNIEDGILKTHVIGPFDNHEFYIDAGKKYKVHKTPTVQKVIFEQNSKAIADCWSNNGKCYDPIIDAETISMMEKRFAELKEIHRIRVTEKLQALSHAKAKAKRK